MEINSATHHDMAFGLFKVRESAEHAYNSLLSRGYLQEEIILIMSDETRKNQFENIDRVDIGLDTVSGSSLLDAITAFGSSAAIPGLDLIIAGPLAAGLSNDRGGLINAFIRAGLPEDHAKEYEVDIKYDGAIAIGVISQSEANTKHLNLEWMNTRKEQG